MSRRILCHEEKRIAEETGIPAAARIADAEKTVVD